jgi:hypothetical protein
MYAPFRDSKPYRTGSNAHQTRSVKPSNGKVIKLIKRSAPNRQQVIKPFKNKNQGL